MEDKQKLVKLLQYYIDHNREHADELVELADDMKGIGIDSAGVTQASELMKKSVIELQNVIAAIE